METTLIISLLITTGVIVYHIIKSIIIYDAIKQIINTNYDCADLLKENKKELNEINRKLERILEIEYKNSK